MMNGPVSAFHGYWYNASFARSLPQLIFDLGGSSADPNQRAPAYGAQKLVQGYQMPGPIAERASRWVEEQILLRDPLPALYPYWATYRHPLTNSWHTVKGVFALVDVLQAPILPHEAILPERLKYGEWFLEEVPLQAAPTQLLYEDPSHCLDMFMEEAMEQPIWQLSSEEGLRHQMGRITKGEAVELLNKAIAGQPLFVADGHHRLAAQQRLARKGKASPLQLVHLVNTAAEAPAILPYHRLVQQWPTGQQSGMLRRLKQNFRVKIFRGPDPLMQWVSDLRYVFGLIRPQADYLLLLRDQVLRQKASSENFEVDLLHEHFLEHALGFEEHQLQNEQFLRYTPSVAECRAAVRSGKAPMALLLKGLSLEQIKNVSRRGDVLPQKATYFYPKIAAGLIFAANKNP